VPDRLLVRADLVLPLDGRRTVIEDGALLVEDGTILAVGRRTDLDPAAESAQVVELPHHVLLPGLHNCHMHSGLLRGTAESLSLWDWLATYVDPAHRVLTPEIAEAASLLCYAECVRSGTVSVMDMWRFMEGSARAAAKVGIRATLVPYLADAPGYDYFESLASNRRLLESVQDPSGRVRAWVGLEHLFYCTPATYEAARALADEFGVGIHTHSSETASEVEDSIARFGRRPIAEIGARGVLGPRTVIAHCVWLDQAEIQLLADTGTAVAHCPTSNMKLSSGVAPIGALRDADVRVGLGTDGEKENNNLDMVEELKFASLLQKVSTGDPRTGDPWEVLEMATRRGADVLGLAEISGSLESGKRADIVAVDLGQLHLTPLVRGPASNVAAHLVFSASGHDVAEVWVDGQHVVGGGRLLTVNEAAVRRQAQAAADELFNRRAIVMATAVAER
jgi:5-methylthioadenosine/S-adenosylhomocysteine deaminase